MRSKLLSIMVLSFAGLMLTACNSQEQEIKIRTPQPLLTTFPSLSEHQPPVTLPFSNAQQSPGVGPQSGAYGSIVIVPPDPKFDYKIATVTPNPNIDYKLIIINPDSGTALPKPNEDTTKGQN